MKKQFITSLLMTVVTTVLLGIIYPLVITGIANSIPGKSQRATRHQERESRSPRILDSPSPGPNTSIHVRRRPVEDMMRPIHPGLISAPRIESSSRNNANAVQVQAENPGAPVPVDFVTTSGSGLQPWIPLRRLCSRFPGSHGSANDLRNMFGNL